MNHVFIFGRRIINLRITFAQFVVLRQADSPHRGNSLIRQEVKVSRERPGQDILDLILYGGRSGRWRNDARHLSKWLSFMCLFHVAKFAPAVFREGSFLAIKLLLSWGRRLGGRMYKQAPLHRGRFLQNLRRQKSSPCHIVSELFGVRTRIKIRMLLTCVTRSSDTSLTLIDPGHFG